MIGRVAGEADVDRGVDWWGSGCVVRGSDMIGRRKMDERGGSGGGGSSGGGRGSGGGGRWGSVVDGIE